MDINTKNIVSTTKTNHTCSDNIKIANDKDLLKISKSIIEKNKTAYEALSK